MPQLNAAFRPYMETRERYAVLVGGAGSGKSYTAADKHLIRVATVPGHRIGYGRKVYKTVRHSAFDTLRARVQDLGLNEVFETMTGDMTIRRRDGHGEFVAFGMDDAEKLKSIHGLTSAWLEEATEFTELDVTQLDLRLRNPVPDGYTQITLTFNPISAMHWLRKRFFDNTSGGVFRLITTYRDNAFLPPEYRATLEGLRDQDENLYRIYTLGEWGVLEGQIYPPLIMHDAADWRTVFDDVFYGLDYGYDNPTALIRVGMYDGQAWPEEVIYERGLTNADLIDRMRLVPLIGRTTIYADAAEPARIEEMRRAGLNVQACDKEQGSVQAGIGLLRGLKIHSRPENANLNREHSSYVWRKDRAGNATDEPVKFNDHALDALRYALYTRLRHGTGSPENVLFAGARRSVQRESLKSIGARIAEEYA